jgi:hypothetical protein
MGWETANIHLGTVDAQKYIRSHLARLKPSWLYTAAKNLEEAVTADWRAWKKSGDFS